MAEPESDQTTCVAHVKDGAGGSRPCGEGAQPRRVFKPVYIPPIMLCDEHFDLVGPKDPA